jgi:hypothetical protein
MPSDQKTMYEPGNPKTSSIFIGAIINCKQSRKIPINFKVHFLTAAWLMVGYGVEVEGDEEV